MGEDPYTERLEWFKQNERPETVLLIGDDKEMIKVVLAWTNTKVRRARELTNLEGESESEVWEWLWENTHYSREELLAKSALPSLVFDKKLIPIIGNRALYPDGTVNSFVQRYLRERVLSLFEVKPGKTTVKSR